MPASRRRRPKRRKKEMKPKLGKEEQSMGPAKR